MTETNQAIMWVYDDGGRAAAGFKGVTGDCAVRAAAIASGEPYKVLYDRIIEIAGKHERRGTRKKHISHPRVGVYRVTMQRLMDELGATWTPVMSIGSGCTMHVRMHELPPGRLVLSLSRHYAACVDGVLHDLSDCSRGGTRAVYGFWTMPED
jgi:hypothetical protein